jgi:hypothetical protein
MTEIRSYSMPGFTMIPRAIAWKAGTAALEIVAAVKGLQTYYRTGEADMTAWRSLLDLHCRTNGRSSDRLAGLLRLMRPARQPRLVSGLLGEFSIEEQERAARSLSQDGYYVFDRKLPSETCDALERFARRMPAVVEGRSTLPEARVRFDPQSPISKTYKIVSEDIVTDPAMQRLMADAVFLAVAERHLGAQPILCGAGMWWSPAYGDKPGDDAAQQFHFDFDGAPIWLKYFVYLTDVGPDNGPHVFVRGSHIGNHPKAAELRRRGYVRFSDEEIAGAFGPENIVELCGQRGTVLAVDTRGFHKGKMPVRGHRLIAQLFFCCPQFNTHGPKQPLPQQIESALKSAIDANPHVFERFPWKRQSI